jgi:hypothetical protein
VQYGFLAGPLGEPLPTEIQRFLDRVKRNPQDYEAVLLASTLHVEPWRSDLFKRLLVVAMESTDPEKARTILEKTLQTLQTIQQEHLSDSQFGRLMDKEKALIPIVAGAFQKRIKEIETRYVRWFEDLLTKALLADDPGTVGREFVLYTLAPETAERVTNSRVPETYYARAGRALKLMAEQRQRSNAAFRQRVEQERKKQGG